jgi:uncharacterized protein with HEPN domain
MSRDVAYLNDMLESARRVLTYTSGLSAADFQHDLLRQDASIRRIEIIGEAASRISARSRKRMADIPWSDIIAQRHVAIHHYHKLTMERIWATIQEDLPVLIGQRQHYLGEANKP